MPASDDRAQDRVPGVAASITRQLWLTLGWVVVAAAALVVAGRLLTGSWHVWTVLFAVFAGLGWLRFVVRRNRDRLRDDGSGAR